MKKMRAAGGVGLLLTGLASPCLASTAPGVTPQTGGSAIVENLNVCRKLPTKEQRADCYDAAVDDLDRAQSAGKVVVIDQDRLKTVRHEAFGFNLPSLSALARGIKDEPVEKVTLEVTGAREDGDERWVIETREHAVWRQTQSSGFALTPHAGSTLVIKPGVLGAFFCQIDRQAPFRCRRDR